MKKNQSTSFPPIFVKRRHSKECIDGILYREGTLLVDRLGRRSNGGIIVHNYICWNGCKAEVFVTERAVRMLAEQALRNK